MIDPANVTACLVTRGDQPAAMRRIKAGLIFENVIVWDNSKKRIDWKCAGRYNAVLEAKTEAVYFQDDDVIVPQETQRLLCDSYKPGTMIANWAHGADHDGYDDIPLVGAGAIVQRELPWAAIARYLEHYRLDMDFRYEADFIAGALYPAFEYRWLAFDIDLAIAQGAERLCNQPWQRDLKFDMTQRARAIRDGFQVAA